ncbi:Ubiquitin thioesterase otulin [Portunus trituberculatus]|uniref:Ubiquitin thioesterase otulin n=1 Tax=Portunus trituberculatus TaxID=210409 RepID=A0A5B7F0M8_PORTR|nr:Ubiquitin thioesterase otulin [Portunus trituberculatus]
MFLLGHTLGVTLQVVRPASYGEDDFICYYPDSNIGLWPEVTLVAEDDRHYNVLIKYEQNFFELRVMLWDAAASQRISPASAEPVHIRTRSTIIDYIKLNCGFPLSTAS